MRKRVTVLGFTLATVAAATAGPATPAEDARFPHGIEIRASLNGIEAPADKVFSVAEGDWQAELNLSFFGTALWGGPTDSYFVDGPMWASLATDMVHRDLFRLEAEVSYLQHDTDIGRSFAIAKDKSDDEHDLIDVEELIAGGRGLVRTKATFINSIWSSAETLRGWSRSWGFGVGLAEVQMDYAPGTISLVDHSEQVMAGQLMMGIMRQTDYSRFSAHIRYRAVGAVQAPLEQRTLVPHLDIEAGGLIAEVGYKLDI